MSTPQIPDPRSLRNRENSVPYQAPEDHELSPEVQLAWFELNREQMQRLYVRAMRGGGLLGAIVVPLILLTLLYTNVGLPALHEEPVMNMVYWLVSGALGGFLAGAGLGALGFWLLQQVQ